MNKYKNSKQNGITLIALVITIIVMLILVGVTISMAVNGGLFNQAGKATGQTKNALEAEQELANGGVKVNGKWYNNIDEYLNKDKKEPISKETSYIGYYADVDGDEIADGVIYADLAIGGSGSWGDPDYEYSYSYEAVEKSELKDYYVSGTYDGVYNEEGELKEVLSAIGDGKDRFYVLALEDFREDAHYGSYTWYYSLHVNENAQDVTEEAFGTGKANTITMVEKWNASAFGTQNGGGYYKDIWGPIQNSVQYDIVTSVDDSGKWFVPSTGELLAFGDALNAYGWDTSEEGEGIYAAPYNLGDCLSSSQAESNAVYSVIFPENYILELPLDGPGGANNASGRLRLSATY